MMASDWDNLKCLRFLELYQTEPVLWDPSETFHKDKRKLHDAWLRISAKMKAPVAELKKKKDSMMATFRSHLRKKKASIKAGARAAFVYIWFAYDVMEQFLGRIYDVTSTIDTELTTEEILQSNLSIEDVVVKTNDSPSGTPEPEETHSPELAQPRQPVHRRPFNPPDLQEPGMQLKEAFSTLNNALKRKPEEEDECDLFGRLLAKKLRKLPELERDLFICEIDDMFIRRIRRLISPLQSSGSSSVIASPMPPSFLASSSNTHSGTHDHPSISSSLHSTVSSEPAKEDVILIL